ncbi:MAG TPA: hypothetical protein P5513_06695 [Candidatus Diapherotrites archaeon]|nr:hypothetical protein [Candidatus Diapherotrites archaeon]
MNNRKKVLVKIKSPGTLNAFGFNSLRTPATVELYEHQLLLLDVQGVQYEIVDQEPKSKPKKESKPIESVDIGQES